MQLEANIEETARLKRLALACVKKFHQVSQNEETRKDDLGAKDGFWASRQSANFNLWCAKLGVHSEGTRSIDVRLKDVPEICEILFHLLQSLHYDLNNLDEPQRLAFEQTVRAGSSQSDNHSETSSLSYESLSSSEDSEAQSATGDTAVTGQRQTLALRRHIEDTIDRLQGQARRVERAGAEHRRKQVERYRKKDRPKQVYEGFKKLGIWKANEQFQLASETTKARIAESFARRRIRFEYLKAHQKKRAINTSNLPTIDSTPFSQLDNDSVEVQELPEKRVKLAPDAAGAPYPLDQQTLFSATLNTTYDLRLEPKRKERAESVRSIAASHTGFPPPPQTKDGKFQCPYCLLEFRAREAEKSRWSQHVMQDFEPYFCIVDGCEAPFDVPNSFGGLLDHLQSHLPTRHHVDGPDGEHREYLESELEDHVRDHGGVSQEILATMKEASRRKGAFLFESCPFCGGYPDVLEKRFPTPDTPEAQIELRRHVKQHMQENALFLPPYRSDIFDADVDVRGSEVVDRQSVDQGVSGNPNDFLMTCGRSDCDCKSKHNAYAGRAYDVPDFAIPEEFWSDLFDDPAVYDRSKVSSSELVNDKCLQSFVLRFILLYHGTEFSDLPKLSLHEREDWTLLLWAAAHGQYAFVRLLLDAGADSEVQDKDGRTPLLWAAVNDHVTTIGLLVDHGANIEARDKNNDTPLSLAIINNSIASVERLVRFGADTEAPGNNNLTLISLAAKSRHKDMIKAVLATGRIVALSIRKSAHDEVTRLELSAAHVDPGSFVSAQNEHFPAMPSDILERSPIPYPLEELDSFLDVPASTQKGHADTNATANNGGNAYDSRVATFPVSNLPSVSDHGDDEPQVAAKSVTRDDAGDDQHGISIENDEQDRVRHAEYRPFVPAATVLSTNEHLKPAPLISQDSSRLLSTEEKLRPNHPPPPEKGNNDALRHLFNAVDDQGSGALDEYQLGNVLLNQDGTHFDIWIVRMMIRMFDTDRKGAIYFDEFVALWDFLTAWQGLFRRFTGSSSTPSISYDGFSDAIVAFGYRLSAEFIRMLYDSFSRKDEDTMTFDLFVQACISLKKMTDLFKKHDVDRDGYVALSFEEALTAFCSLNFITEALDRRNSNDDFVPDPNSDVRIG